MARRFRVASEKVAVWDGHTDLAPFNDPLNPANIGRVKFHSDIPYVKIVAVKTFAVTIPSIPTSGSGGSGGAAGVRSKSYTLGAHGRTGQPFIIGRIVVNGVPVAFTGSIPVHKGSNPGDPYGRWLALGADATNVYIHEYAVQAGSTVTGQWMARPAQTFSITCYITDIML